MNNHTARVRFEDHPAENQLDLLAASWLMAAMCALGFVAFQISPPSLWGTPLLGATTLTVLKAVIAVGAALGMLSALLLTAAPKPACDLPLSDADAAAVVAAVEQSASKAEFLEAKEKHGGQVTYANVRAILDDAQEQRVKRRLAQTREEFGL